MFELFPPPLGTRIADRFELQAPLRGDGPVQTFLAHDHQTGRRRAISLFDRAAAPPPVWAEYARIIAAAAAARIPGLVLPPQVPPTAPDPPHVIEEPPAHRSLDRLYAQEGRLPWQRALTLGERVAGVLHAAHAATGIAHRALTPSRILVDPRDEIELLDYGAAEIELSGDPPDEPGYRAPEQRTSKGDHRSDIYTLAAILHELIYGVCPTGAPQARPAASALVPPNVDRLLRQSLVHDPAQRPADFAALRNTLRELLGLPPLPARPSATPSIPTPPPPSKPIDNPPAPRTSATSLAPAPRSIPTEPVRPAQLKTIEPPIERTEKIAPTPIRGDTTLQLPATGESTERLPPIARLQPSKPPPEDPQDNRTEVFTRPRIPPQEQTEKLSDPEPDRTLSFNPAPGRNRPLPPERTELLGPPRKSDDEDRTLVMSRRTDIPAQPPPPSSSQLDPTVAFAVPRPPPREPAPPPPAARPLDTTLQLLSPPTPAPEGTLRTMLIAVNLLLGLVLVIVVVWLAAT